MTAATLNPPDAGTMLRGRVAVSLCFLTFGMALGLWFIHIPLIAARLELPPGLLGLLILVIALCGLVTQPIAGIAVARFGARRITMILMPGTIACNLLLILSPSVPLLFVFAALLGSIAIPAVVADNTLAAEYETLRGRPVMSSFHGFFSLGGLIASVLGGLLISAGYGDGRGAIGVDAILFVVAIWASYAAVDGRGAQQAGPAKPSGPRFALPSAAVLGVALIALVCNTIEGSVGDWSAIYLATVKNTGPALAASGYAMFSVAMTILRFAGGPIIERLGTRTLVIGGGVLMAIGMLIVVLAPWPLASALGFLVVAIGASNISPILVSAAAHTPGVEPAIGVAAVGTFMTLGLLGGPPVIGFIAQGWGIGAGLAFVALLGVIVAIGAALRDWQTPAPAAA